MPETQVQSDGKPPTKVKTGCGFADDDVRELGDRIAGLSREKARDLWNYLETLS
jgi:hypothetical protein